MIDHLWTMFTGVMATIGFITLLMWFYWHAYILIRMAWNALRTAKKRKSNPYRSQA